MLALARMLVLCVPLVSAAAAAQPSVDAPAAQGAASVDAGAGAGGIAPGAAAAPALATVRFEPGGGLRIDSGDGAFGLRLGARLQLRYSVRAQDHAGDVDVEQALGVRRARLTVAGHAFGETASFKIQLNLVGAPLLHDGDLDFAPLRALHVRAGYFKVPSNREWLTSSADLALVDRSLFSAELSLGRAVGVDVYSPDVLGHERLRYHAAVFVVRDGPSADFGDFRMLYGARLAVRALGAPTLGLEVDFDRGAPALDLAAGYAFMDGARRDRGVLGAALADGGTARYHFAYVDALFEARGLSALGQVGLRYGTRHVGPLAGTPGPDGAPVGVDVPRNGVAAMVQASYLLSAVPVGITSRYTRLAPLERPSRPSAVRATHEVGVGLSYYFAGDAFKLQADYERRWFSGGGATEADQVARVQVQLTL